VYPSSAKSQKEKIMARVEGSINIQASIDQAWAFLHETEKLPDWMPLMLEVKDIKGQGVGLNYKWAYKLAGIRFEGESLVVEETAPQKSVIKSKGGIVSTWTWTFAAQGNGTTVKVEVDYTVPIPVLGKLAEKIVTKMNQRELELTLANLKEILES
jgi:uncharacterized membrane protein